MSTKPKKRSWIEYVIYIDGELSYFRRSLRAQALEAASAWRRSNKELNITKHIIVKKVRVTEI